MKPEDFLSKVDSLCKKQVDRAIALLWFVGRQDQTLGYTAREIANILRDAGHPAQNVSRIDGVLSADRRTAVAKAGGWALRPGTRRELDTVYGEYEHSKVLPASDSIVPISLIAGTRGYIEKVCDQINKSFDAHLYDCTAVMCRRLLETLIIEVYESEGRAIEIRNGRHFIGLSEMVTYLEKDASLFISKPAMNALKNFKTLGDLSAHNRHYNARETDIEPHRVGIRLIVEELLYRADLHPSRKTG